MNPLHNSKWAIGAMKVSACGFAVAFRSMGKPWHTALCRHQMAPMHDCGNVLSSGNQWLHPVSVSVIFAQDLALGNVLTTLSVLVPMNRRSFCELTTLNDVATMEENDKDKDGASNESESDPTSSVESQSYRICNVLLSGTYDSKTIALLEPFAKGLSPRLVARVVNRLSNLEVAKRFFLWAGEQDGYRHNTFVYNALLLKLGVQKQFTAIWELVDDMQRASCAVNSTTFTIIIKYYGKAGMLEEAWNTVNRAERFNCRPDTQMYTALINILFEAGKVNKAESLLSQLFNRGFVIDTRLWSTVIHGLCKNRQLCKAQMYFDLMLSQGGSPDVFIYNALLLGLREEKCLDKANSLLNVMQKNGCKPDVYTYNAYIGLCCDCNKFTEAEEILCNMTVAGCDPDQVIYNTFLSGLVKRGKFLEADEFFKKMQSHGWVDDVSYRIFTVHLRKHRDINKLMSISEELHSRYSTVNVQVCNAILQQYCDDANVDEAEKYFNEVLSKLTAPDQFSYALMINGHCKLGNFDAARSLLLKMEGSGCKPNTECYNPLIIGLCKGSRDIEALHVFEEMLDKGIEPGSVSCEFLLRSLSGAGAADAAVRLCKHIIDKRFGVKDSTVLLFVRSLDKVTRLEEAKCLVNMMQRRGCLPNSRRFNCALQIMLSGNIDEAEKFFCSSQGLEAPNTISYALKIRGRCKYGELDEAKRLLLEMKENGCAPSASCYSPLIGGLNRAGRLIESFKLFEEMLESGIESSTISSNLMEKLCEAGMVEEILRLGKHIIERGMTIRRSSVSSLVVELIKPDRQEEVTNLLNAMRESKCIKAPK